MATKGVNLPMFIVILRTLGIPRPEEEFRFHQHRLWRFDLAWPENKIAVEIEGGTFTGGRHVRGKGYARDCEKYNEAALLGWRILRFTTDLVANGCATTTIQRAFGKLT